MHPQVVLSSLLLRVSQSIKMVDTNFRSFGIGLSNPNADFILCRKAEPHGTGDDGCFFHALAELQAGAGVSLEH